MVALGLKMSALPSRPGYLWVVQMCPWEPQDDLMLGDYSDKECVEASGSADTLLEICLDGRLCICPNGIS